MKSFFSLVRPHYSKPQFNNTFVINHSYLFKRFYTVSAVTDNAETKPTYAYPNPSTTVQKKNLIEEAIKDHRVIKDLWKRFEKEKNNNERQKIANTIIREASIHSAAEEIIVYPLLEKYFTSGEDVANHSRSEHLQLKKDLHQLDSMKVTDPEYDQLFTKAMKEFERHASEEEGDSFPQLRKAIGSEEQLDKLGVEFEKTRPKVPTRPHPSAPDQPPFETIAGMATAPLDKGRDMAREFVKTIRDKL